MSRPQTSNRRAAPGARRPRRDGAEAFVVRISTAPLSLWADLLGPAGRSINYIARSAVALRHYRQLVLAPSGV